MKFCGTLIIFLLILKGQLWAQWDISNYPSPFYYFEGPHVFIDSNSILAGDLYGTFYSPDRGKNFQLRSTASWSSNNELQLLGNGNLFRSGVGMFISKDTGRTFLDFPLISDNLDTFSKANKVIAFRIFANGKGFILDWKKNAGFRYFKTLDFGQSWSLQDTTKIKLSADFYSDDFQTTEVRNRSFYFDSTVYKYFSFSNNSSIIKITNYGDSMETISLRNLLNRRVFDMAFEDENKGLFLGFGNSIHRTEDGMQSFVKLDSPQVLLSRIAFAPKSKDYPSFYMAGYFNGYKGSFYSLNEGKTWNSTGDVFNYESLFFLNSSFGISCSANNGERIRYFTGLPFNSVPHQKLGQLNFELFPNPAQSHFRIQGAEIHSTITVSIYDIHGKLISKSLQSIQTDWVVPVNSLSSGIYVVSLKAYHSDYPVFRRLVIE
ncbi:MAG: T9SS type A sorting domain-containing protein [Bacteroidetes bacterium]|nr:T9SS type A sorting domain-containing protein [Bacteroidota bacterium]MCK6611601.1 T9SS type A sorting domain-containing protein [Bacteroidia bacterium]